MTIMFSWKKMCCVHHRLQTEHMALPPKNHTPLSILTSVVATESIGDAPVRQ